MSSNSQGFKFQFDSVFSSSASQQDLYNETSKNVVADALAGYNSTIMAYGQTGSGKTYTMFGDLSDPSRMGIIPRVSRDIFRSIQDMLDS